LTAKSTILETLQYMAPAQVEGLDADHRADTWAFGCIVHEMLTRRDGVHRAASGEPGPLFRPRLHHHRLGWSRYDNGVTSDGQRFLVNALVGDVPPATVTVVINFLPS
jgi:serine/threonine protein kinase